MKRLFDLFLSVLILIFIFPFLVLLLIILVVAYNGNPFFTQLRPGKDEKLFQLIKFKTMTDERDGNGQLLPDKDRLTKIGKFIRSTSLDELPQLLNVIKGDMSLIGPRPLLAKYLPRYNQEQKKRHNVKPGITGWAQVNGRNAISWEKKLEYDVYYVDNISFSLDLKIFYLTLIKVLKRSDISSSTSSTMEEFLGNDKT